MLRDVSKIADQLKVLRKLSFHNIAQFGACQQKTGAVACFRTYLNIIFVARMKKRTKPKLILCIQFFVIDRRVRGHVTKTARITPEPAFS